MAPRKLFEIVTLSLGALALLVQPRAAGAAAFPLNVKIIHAHNKGKQIDPKLEKLAKQFTSLKFTAFELKDEASFDLEIGASGSMQLPGGEWLKINAKGIEDDKLRLELVVEKLKFKTTAAITPGATLAIGGPPFADGALILAVTRPKSR